MTTAATAGLAERALDPGHSVVVAACAGSGKTWLLVSRILRLLLAGVSPGEILAITFTRYAAQEMASRLREWLQELAGADDEQVRRLLQERFVPADEIEATLSRGRGLYESVLAAQPGITISTFHSWYIRLLRSAPLGAGALGDLTLSEQMSALIDEAWDLFAEACRRNPADDAAAGLDVLLREYGRDGAKSLLESFLHHRADWWAYAGRGKDAVASVLASMRHALDVDPHADLLAGALGDAAMRTRMSAFGGLLGRNVASDQAHAAALGDALASGDVRAVFDALNAALFTGKGEPRQRKPSKALQGRLGVDGENDFLALHAALCERMQALKSALIDQRSYRMHAAALPAAVGLLETYQQIKLDRQVVDFADVEWLAFDLMTQHEQAITLQFKLDSRYRHILLDEFQDTNPLQWLAMKAWFEASAEVDSSPKVFLVGDPKQAIYRFRRAEAKLFGAATDWLVAQHGACVLSQDESRRCAQPVLDVVNRVFAAEPACAADFRPHSAHSTVLPGRVEVLPLARRSPDDALPDAEPAALRDPLETPARETEDLRREAEAGLLVDRLKEIVGHWHVAVGTGQGKTRPARYGDVMILVRRRTHLQVYERALRHAGIPFATSRRGGLLDTLEVQDLVALLEFLVSPFDDLKLAHALKSPIFGCEDEDLLVLARCSGPTWWSRLSELQGLDDGSALGRARALLTVWLDRADRLPVHDHLDRIYAEGDLERRYAEAVPDSAREAVVANLHAFIERALAVDAGRYPSLPRFLDELREMRAAPLEEAPDEGGIDNHGNAVRILTVHGAKGLEAPIVWLLDAAAGRTTSRGHGVLVDWPPGDERPTSFSFRTGRSDLNRLQRRQIEEEDLKDEREDLNLLYVAMTRARQVLIASGCEGRGWESSWYARMRAAVSADGSDPAATVVFGADFDRLDSAADSHGNDDAPAIDGAVVPAILVPDVIPTGRRVETTESAGHRYGTAFHKVMECLSTDAGADAERIARGFGLAQSEARLCARQARTLLAAPELQRFFDAGAFVRAANEVPLINEDGELRRIDRVVEFEEEVWVLDYKTGRHADLAGSPLEQAYREQVAHYCRSLGRVHESKIVRGALVFSDGTLVGVE